MSDFTPLHTAFDQVRAQIARVVVGRDDVVEQLLITLLAEGHCLFEGPAGSARAWTAEALANTLQLRFRRIGCTPDLTAEELVGPAAGDVAAGATDAPIQANLILVDGIDRLMPRTRAVFEQAMQTGSVQLGTRRIELPRPLLVMAARYRPIEPQGDVADEPRCDRFFSKILLAYPTYHDEFRLAEANVTPHDVDLESVLDAESIQTWRQAVREATAPEHVVHYALRLVRATRVHEGENPDFIYEWVAAGAGSRAARQLLQAARIRGALQGRQRATSDDVRAMTHCILRHRIVVNQNAITNGITPDQVIDRLLYEIPERIDDDDRAPEPGEAPDFHAASDIDLL